LSLGVAKPQAGVSFLLNGLRRFFLDETHADPWVHPVCKIRMKERGQQPDEAHGQWIPSNSLD
jgi:hypothetical protein